MEQLNIDCGLEEYAVGGAVLRFNPTDPNLYARFMQLEGQLGQLRKELELKVSAATEASQVLTVLEETDRTFKDLLTRVFGPQNDFSKLMEGVNLLAMGNNGLSVGENLLMALEPVLMKGAERFAGVKTREAVEKARQRRAGL